MPGEYHAIVSAANLGANTTSITLTVGAKQVLNMALAVGTSKVVVEVSIVAELRPLGSGHQEDDYDTLTYREGLSKSVMNVAAGDEVPLRL